MIITTSDLVAGRDIVEALGVVRGNVVRARFVGTDLLAGLRMLAGGEVNEYTKLMATPYDIICNRTFYKCGNLVGRCCFA